MTLRSLFPVVLALAGVVIAGCQAGRAGPDVRRDAGPRGEPDAGFACTSTVDSDGDGIADEREGAFDSDGDGRGNDQDDDSDGDGRSDRDEAMSSNPCAPRDTDGDSSPDFLDTDADNDGVSDAEELGAGTDPILVDTDGDGVSDLGERAAGTDPRDPASTIPEGDFFVVLPYNGAREMRPLRFGTNIQQADVYFLIDTTGSMQGAIDDVNSSLMSIVTRVRALVPDTQFGVGHFDDIPISPYGNTDSEAALYGLPRGDMPYWHLVDITDDLGRVNSALTLRANAGNDTPESNTIGLYLTATGMGLTYADGDRGTASIPPKSCPSIPDEMGVRRGYPCFRGGSLPIVVMVSDAPWHNGAGGTNGYGGTAGAVSFDMAVDAVNAIGGRIVGANVGFAGSGPDMMEAARRTGSVDSAGNPLVFTGPASTTADQIITGITTLIGGTPQDVSTTTENVPGNPDEFDATTFIKAIVPDEGYRDGIPGPNPGVSYASKDDTTFYEVIPGTLVDFNVDFWNDVRPPAAVAQVFRARIIVLGNGVARLDQREVYIIVPPEGGTILI